jgi:poly-gamma-glutamate synthesis protein (capsule biosynthesis protein)
LHYKAVPVNLVFVGDVMLGRLVNEVLEQRAPAYPWGDTLGLFRSADWRACNLECVIADRGSPWTTTPKAFHFRSDAKNVAVLQAAGIDAVSLANNHVLDFGYDAFDDMLRILDGARIGRAGAGPDRAQASRPAISRTAAGRLGLIAFTDNQAEWEAPDDGPGILYVPVDPGDPRAKRLLHLVSRTRADVDFLVVSTHWGPNWGYAPPPEHVPFARALVDAGADLVFGHSGHVVRGIEVYRHRPIFYCTGDFVDDYAVDPTERNDESLIFIVHTEGWRVRSLRLYPTIIRRFQALLARGAERQRIGDRMRALCARLGTAASWQDDAGCLEIAVS